MPPSRGGDVTDRTRDPGFTASASIRARSFGGEFPSQGRRARHLIDWEAPVFGWKAPWIGWRAPVFGWKASACVREVLSRP